jgi:hypothetical protein
LGEKDVLQVAQINKIIFLIDDAVLIVGIGKQIGICFSSSVSLFSALQNKIRDICDDL